MKEGAFAFLDCLGFKGIWNRGIAPEQILEFLKAAQAYSQQSPTSAAVQFLAGSVEQSVVFISDTIAISTRYKVIPKMAGVARGYLLLITIHLTIELCRRFATAPAPLMFRGSITYGPHIAEDRFLLGPAVDDAAAMAQTTQGAFIWLDPKAAKLFRDYVEYDQTLGAEALRELSPADAVSKLDAIINLNKRFQSQTVLPNDVEKNRIWWDKLTIAQKQHIAAEILSELARNRRGDQVVKGYAMDMKAGGQLRADVVNPLLVIHPDQHSAWIERVLSGFSDSPIEVLMKKQNTARFLAAASDAARAALSRGIELQDILRSKYAQRTGVPF